MGTSLRTVWSTISWTSSNPDVISIQKPSIDSSIYAATGVINQPVEDTEVTLTATFTANESVMNEQVEKISDINNKKIRFTEKDLPTDINFTKISTTINSFIKVIDTIIDFLKIYLKL